MAPRRIKTSKGPNPKLMLPWGYDAPAKDTTPLHDFIKFITDPAMNPAEIGTTKTVLVYWDRGTVSRGDEAKMAEIGIDSDRYFAHVLDIQEWFQVLFPKGEDGKQKHGLKEAAQMMNITTVSQRSLDNVEEVARAYIYGAMLHCAGGDAEITLRLFMEVIMQKIKDLNDEDEGERKLRDDFCFMGLDFEGGGKIGQGTTEIGLSLLFSDGLSAEDDYLSRINNRHAIIWEMFDNHIPKIAQAGKIDIDAAARGTYPRWNFQGGPNNTEKESFCYSPRPNSMHKVFDISVDSEVIYMHNRAWWILHQIPGSSNIDPQVKYSLAPGPYLTLFNTCMHKYHQISGNNPMRPLPEDEHESGYYSM